MVGPASTGNILAIQSLYHRNRSTIPGIDRVLTAYDFLSLWRRFPLKAQTNDYIQRLLILYELNDRYPGAL